MLANMFGPKNRTSNPPEDLRPTLGEAALAKLSGDAAQMVALQKPWLVGSENTASTTRRLLALLTFCYAAGIYGSQEIESAAQHEPVVRSLCDDSAPNWSVLWRFRNANRPWIEECLARVYAAVTSETPSGSPENPVNGPATQSALPPKLVDFARRKVRQAVLVDSALYE